MKIQGKLIMRGDTLKVSEKFQKREFVIEYAENPTYPQFIKFQLTQDKCSLINGFKIGAELEVSFNLRGREWTNKKGETVYFNTIEAWKIDPIEAIAQDVIQAANAEDLPF